MEAHVDIKTLGEFAADLPVSTDDDVKMFGIVVLGLDYYDVERIIHSKKEKLQTPKAAADLLQYWLDHKPDSTAQELLHAMRESNFSKQNVDAFENFLKTQKYTKGMIPNFTKRSDRPVFIFSMNSFNVFLCLI